MWCRCAEGRGRPGPMSGREAWPPAHGPAGRGGEGHVRGSELSAVRDWTGSGRVSCDMEQSGYTSPWAAVLGRHHAAAAAAATVPMMQEHHGYGPPGAAPIDLHVSQPFPYYRCRCSVFSSVPWSPRSALQIFPFFLWTSAFWPLWFIAHRASLNRDIVTLGVRSTHRTATYIEEGNSIIGLSL